MFISSHERPSRKLAHAYPEADGQNGSELATDWNAAPLRPGGPAAAMPAEYWDAILRDAGSDARPAGRPIQSCELLEIGRHVLRVSCSRCARTVEIQEADEVRLYGADAIWKTCAQRLLGDTCTQRTGRLEEDGCWPSFE